MLLLIDIDFACSLAAFKFSDLTKIQNKKPIRIPPNRSSQRTIVCQNALLMAANKRYALLHNMNSVDLLYCFDTQEDQTKELPWDEGSVSDVSDEQERSESSY